MLKLGSRSPLSTSIENIVFATDFLESSRLALDYAVAFARTYKAKLIIVHAFSLSVEAEEAEILGHHASISRAHAAARLQAFANGIRRLGVQTEVDLRTGYPYDAVLKAAIDNKADLLVLGTHGVYRGVQHVLIGSNAEKILLAAPCPTLTVGRHVMAGIDLELAFEKIIFVSDLSSDSKSAALYADSISQDLNIPVDLLEVLPEEPGDVRDAVESYCKDLCSVPAFAGSIWCDPQYHLNRLVPAQEVIQRAMICNDCLLVLGVHQESRWKRHLHASFAFELVARSSSPVLSVHKL